MGCLPLGNKSVLIDRLAANIEGEEGRTLGGSRSLSASPTKLVTVEDIPGPSREQRSKSTTPTKGQSRSISPLRVGGRRIPRFSPFKYISNATLHSLEVLLESIESIGLRGMLPFLLGFVMIALMSWVEGPHTSTLKSAQDAILWYAHWFTLGAIATVAVGPASKTFATHLMPFVSRVTSVAVGCGSTSFGVYGEGCISVCGHEGAS